MNDYSRAGNKRQSQYVLQTKAVVDLTPDSQEVVTIEQARAMLASMLGQYRLMGELMLNCGLHPLECIDLRVRHIRLDQHQIFIPNILGVVVRKSFVPASLSLALNKQLSYLKFLHNEDLRAGFGDVTLPPSFSDESVVSPKDFSWQWFFSNSALCLDCGGDDAQRRQHILCTLDRRIKQAALSAKVGPVVDRMVFWRCFHIRRFD